MLRGCAGVLGCSVDFHVSELPDLRDLAYGGLVRAHDRVVADPSQKCGAKGDLIRSTIIMYQSGLGDVQLNFGGAQPDRGCDTRHLSGDPVVFGLPLLAVSFGVAD
ncbi:MAG: hypothetical protein EBT09_13765, partial [Actinobacteria bacterium]|nr:hypothetical protein [Actinomycetota bacterium]